MGDDAPDRDAPLPPVPVIVVVMGVSGVGKTTIGRLLAAALDCPFQEGDDLHPAANIAKMVDGTPLTDADRLPWLHRITAVIDDWRRAGRSGVLSCSALTRPYRDIIIGARADVTLVYLRSAHDLVARRMAARQGHFMPPALLDSQFTTLEAPQAGENVIVVDTARSPPEIVDDIVQELAAAGAGR